MVQNSDGVHFDVVTIFPDVFDRLANIGVVGRALQTGLIKLEVHDLRDFCDGAHRIVDDAPYGGGPGMVLMIEPMDNAISQSKKDVNIFLTPDGQELNEDLIEELHTYKSANIICGRYEGFDQRILELHSDYEISIGKTVVSGGEVPAMFLMEALLRKLPGILGNSESLKYESFVNDKYDHPTYTRPEVYKGFKVPDVLLSGDHKKIDEWKKNNLKDI